MIRNTRKEKILDVRETKKKKYKTQLFLDCGVECRYLKWKSESLTGRILIQT